MDDEVVGRRDSFPGIDGAGHLRVSDAAGGGLRFAVVDAAGRELGAVELGAEACPELIAALAGRWYRQKHGDRRR